MRRIAAADRRAGRDAGKPRNESACFIDLPRAAPVHSPRRRCGTVFAITTTGKEHVVYDFGGSNDGAILKADVIDVNGTLYGTTTRGGTSSACYDAADAVSGCGTIFGVSSSGAETVLHDFTGGSDGALPIATLLDVHGTLYGTTEYKFSGEHGHPRGYGTVFALSL